MSATRQERVLRMHFGIGTTTDRTLEEVGQQFSVNRERIREGAKEAEASERQLEAAEFLG
jgi:DNA-directed RNA polymerase sigma subunit (sigma70/sigma32)